MSFRHKNENKDVDNKGRLEAKLYLARENPAPIFDISNCALKNVPSGIYSLCKVFRKTDLYMGNNRLSSLSGGGQLSDLSLITVLDISHNEFTHLPDEISYLIALQELYLHHNKLKNLPPKLTCLFDLRILNLANNKFKYLPETMGNMKQLNILDLSENNLLKQLPKSLGELDKLVELNVQGLKNITYPPNCILECGTKTIVNFLSDNYHGEYNDERIPKSEFLNAQLDQFNSINISSSKSSEEININDNNFQATLTQLEKLKERRQNALLEVEKNMKELQQQELEIQLINKGHKKKLLEDIALEQSRLNSQIERLQQEKELNRSRLLNFIYQAENEADSVIEQFLKSSEAERSQVQIILLEREKQEQLELLSKCQMNQSSSLHRTKETLAAMEKILEEELLTEKKIEDYTKFRDCNIQSLLSIQLNSDDHLASVIKDQKRDRENLLDRLRKDEILQKAALAGLLERSDARSWSIVQQVKLIESQLVALTNIELERKKLEINQQINDIAEKRVILSDILMSLLDQQEKRREQLLDTINQIEKRRNDDKNEKTQRRNSLFWLMQYQSLMDTRPQGLLEGLDPSLVRHVAIAGALHCLPFLTSVSSLLPNNIDDEQLEALGINSVDDRRAIRLAVENYLAEQSTNKQELLVPSAPIAEDVPGSSSNTNTFDNVTKVISSECAICLDLQSDIIFLPCGHFCCCALCSNKVTNECPMCRGHIQRKIQVHKS